MANLLSIPSSKTLLRRHLTLCFNTLVGQANLAIKRECESQPTFKPLTTTGARFNATFRVMDSLRIALEISMTKISQPRRRRRRHSLLFWYLLPLLSPVSIKAVDTIEAAADMVVTDDTDAADAGFPKFEPVRIKR